MKLYVVRNKEGKFFKNIGYGGFGKSWVDGIDKAKLYTKLGQAKSRVTFFFKNYPTYGCPDIIEFTLNEAEGVVIGDMMDATNKRIAATKRANINRQIRSLNWTIKHNKSEVDRINKLPAQQHDRHVNKQLNDHLYEIRNYEEKIKKLVDERNLIK